MTPWLHAIHQPWYAYNRESWVPPSRPAHAAPTTRVPTTSPTASHRMLITILIILAIIALILFIFGR